MSDSTSAFTLQMVGLALKVRDSNQYCVTDDLKYQQFRIGHLDLHFRCILNEDFDCIVYEGIDWSIIIILEARSGIRNKKTGTIVVTGDPTEDLMWLYLKL